MQQIEYPQLIKSPGFTRIGLMAIGGAICGLLILQFLGLSKWWVIFTLLGMIVSFAAILSGNLKRFFLLSLVLVLPINADINFYISKVTYRGLRVPTFEGLGLSLIDVILFSLYSIWFIELVTNQDAKIRFFPKTSIPFLCFILVAILSLTQTIYIIQGLLGIIIGIKSFMLYFYLANNVDDSKTLKHVTILLIVGVIFQGIIAFLQKWSGVSLELGVLGETEMYISKNRVGGTLGHPNSLGYYLILMLPLSMSLLFSEIKKTYKLLYALGVGVGFVALLLTMSRGAWIGFSVAISVVLLSSLWKTENKKGMILSLTVIVLIVGVITLIFSDSILNRALTLDPAALSRIPMMEVAFSIIKDNPLLGVGKGSYLLAMRSYDSTIEQISSNFWYPVHNIYLHITAEIGIFGLLAFLWFLFSLFKEGWQCIKSNDNYISYLAVGIITGFSAVLIQGMVDSFSNKRFVPFYFMAGMLVAMKRIVLSNPDGRARPASEVFSEFRTET